MANQPPQYPSRDLDSWVLAHIAEAVAYATSLLQDRVTAEDIVQDCYCRLLARADVYDLPRDGRKLLFRSITNACINLRSRRMGGLSLTLHDGGSREVGDPRMPSPERVLMHRELEQAVADGLAELSLPQRAALEMKSLGHSLEEIGQALNISGNHAGVLIHRARQAMARYLAPYLEERAG